MNKFVKVFFSITMISSLILSVSLNTYAWESSGSNQYTNSSTHQFVVEKAVQILESDMASTLSGDSNFQILKNRISKLKDGSIAPDNLQNVALGGLTESDWWSSHFYDADTGKSYSSSTPYINAEYQTRRFFQMAVSDFKNGDYDSAIYKLGYASHLFGVLLYTCFPFIEMLTE